MKNSDLVFVGYGVVAPEYKWNDYAGVDVKGKTVVILINDPGNEDANPDPKFFKGRAMTYYGRWTYKYEEAARQGAAAAIIVHETKPAAYGWQVVRTSNCGAKLWLDADGQEQISVADPRLDHAGHRQGPVHPRRARLRGAESGRQQARLQGGGDERRKPGRQRPFDRDHLKTRNVVGVIAGTRHPDDMVIYLRRIGIIWAAMTPLPGPDKIYNGAVDNGMGVAQALDLAEKFVHDKRPQRSLAFAFWTLEEQGLLGSEYFAEHPLWPRNHIVGVFNTDADGPSPLSHDMEAARHRPVGNGRCAEESAGDAAPHAVARPRAGERPFLSAPIISAWRNRAFPPISPTAVTTWWWAAKRRARSCPTTMSITAITSPATNGAPTGI